MREINACIVEIRTWMIQNLLKVNEGKTEAIVICSLHLRSKVTISHFEVGNASIVPSDVVRDIGAFIDQSMKMQHYVQHVSSSASFHLQNIGKIHQLL